MHDRSLAPEARLAHPDVSVFDPRHIQASRMERGRRYSLQGISNGVNLCVKKNRIRVTAKLCLKWVRLQLVDPGADQLVANVNRCGVTILVEHRHVICYDTQFLKALLVFGHR
jgi:hypothetical protein